MLLVALGERVSSEVIAAKPVAAKSSQNFC
jgi:hypothetical protein